MAVDQPFADARGGSDGFGRDTLNGARHEQVQRRPLNTGFRRPGRRDEG